MLKDNIKSIRKSKGLSQEELAERLNVVRQTVSKWEQGLSVPDADLLIAISEVLDTPVAVLLGECVPEEKPGEIKALSEKLEFINAQLARKKESERKAWHWFFIGAGAFLLIVAAVLIALGSPYLKWDLSDPELAVAGTFYHAFEFLFFRIAPFVFVGTVAGAILTRKKR